MHRYLCACKKCIQAIRNGLSVCAVTVSDKDLVPAWCDGTIDFTTDNDVDTCGLPFVFECGLMDGGTGDCEPYSVYVVCMGYFRYYKPDIRSYRFGAVSVIGRTDKFSPERIIKIAREKQAHALKILAEVKRI